MISDLSFSPIARTTSPEETEHLFGQLVTNSRILNVEKSDTFGVEMNSVSIGSAVLSHVRHLSKYDIDCGDIDGAGSIIFGFGYGQPLSASFNGKKTLLNTNAAVFSNRTNVVHTRAAESNEVFIKYTVEDTKKRLQVLLDRSISRELFFGTDVTLENGVGAHARSTLFYMLNSLGADPTLLDNPLIAANYEDLIFGLILSMPSNYSDELLDPGGKSTAPALVSRAEEFMESSAGLPIAIADVLLHTGCSRKALFASFRKSRGYTPNEFLANARLRLAHARLSHPSNSDSVTSIAYDSGFSHMGRFSEVYRKRYGVKPSETLMRASRGLSA